MEQQGDILSGVVSAVAFGGEGIVKEESGRVVFIPFTAVGDKITYRITEDKKHFARGHQISMITPSHDRTSPQCPHFTQCAGCQLQHLSYPAQLRAKKQFVMDALKRIAFVETNVPDVIPSPTSYQYRKHITLQLKTSHNRLDMGYTAFSFLPINHCPIFRSIDDPLWGHLRRLIHSLEPVDGRVRVIMTDEGAVLAFSFLKRPSGFETLARKELTYWRGIALEDVFIGDCTIPFQAKDCMFELSPYSFMQNHLNLTPFLYEKIVALVEGKRVLDLYAGSGIVSTLLAKQQKDVLCIESAFEAMIAAKKNQQLNHVSFDMLHERVEHRLIDHLDSYQPDTVIVNPPRVGIHESVAHALKEKGPSTVIYMSCMPTTFARDLKRMSHYTIHQLFLYDTFPQTTHVEMIAQLQRKPSI